MSRSQRPHCCSILLVTVTMDTTTNTSINSTATFHPVHTANSQLTTRGQGVCEPLQGKLHFLHICNNGVASKWLWDYFWFLESVVLLAEMPIASGAAGRVDVDTSTTWTPDGLKRKTKPAYRNYDSYLQRWVEHCVLNWTQNREFSVFFLFFLHSKHLIGMSVEVYRNLVLSCFFYWQRQ